MGAWSGEVQPWRAAYSKPLTDADVGLEPVALEPLALEPAAIITKPELDRVMPWLEAALAHGHGTHNVLDVIQAVADNRATLWTFEHSAVVTEIVYHPRAIVLNFWLAGGDLDDLLIHEPGIVAWGKRQGCTQASVVGRKGWLRSLAPLGYRPSYYCTMKELV